MSNNLRKTILEQSSYWVEAINGQLYDSIAEYMERENLNKTQLAEKLEISASRVSQILNTGNINFSIEKIIKISLIIGFYPLFDLISKDKYNKNNSNSLSFSMNSETEFMPKGKVISIKKNVDNSYKLAI